MKKIRNLEFMLEDSTIGNMVRRKAEKNGDKTFLRFEGKSFSYRQVHEISNRLAMRWPPPASERASMSPS